MAEQLWNLGDIPLDIALFLQILQFLVSVHKQGCTTSIMIATRKFHTWVSAGDMASWYGPRLSVVPGDLFRRLKRSMDWHGGTCGTLRHLRHQPRLRRNLPL